MLAGLLATGLIYAAGKAGIGLDQASADLYATKAMVLVTAYLGAQGLSDHGKEAATIKADAPAATK